MSTIIAAAALLGTVEAHVFAIVLSNMSRVQASLENIAKRAARKGLPIPTWSWGETTTQIEKHMVWHETYTDMQVEREFRVSRIALSLSAVPQRFDGWRFVAAITHLGQDGNLVRCLPGEECPAAYRTSDSNCDHCRTFRRRNETYILRHEDGRMVQVGSSCIGDFLNGHDASKAAGLAEIFADLRRAADEGMTGDFGAKSDAYGLDVFLSEVAFDVRECGWTSRGTARDQGKTATADFVWNRLHKKGKATDEDKALATAAIDWARDLSDEAVNVTSDYLSNIRVVARVGFATHKSCGLAASIIVAYQRAIGASRKPNQTFVDAYIGTVGAKVTFGLPAKTGKKGQPLKNAPTVLSSDPVTLVFVTGYDTDYGYTTVLKFRSQEGHCIVWKSTATDLKRDDVGKTYSLAGTVKAHTDYKGAKQTLMTRCAVTEIPAPAADGSLAAFDAACEAAQ